MKTLLVLCLVALVVVSVRAVCHQEICNKDCHTTHHKGGTCHGGECICDDGHHIHYPTHGVHKRQNIQCTTNDQCTDDTNHCPHGHAWECKHDHCQCTDPHHHHGDNGNHHPPA